MVGIEPIYNEKRFVSYCKKLTRATGLHDDLLQHCAIRIYEGGRLTKLKNSDDLFKYFVVVAREQYIFERSKFNKLYSRLKEIPTEPRDQINGDEPNPFKQFLNKKLAEAPTNKTDFVYKEIFYLYLKHGSIRQVCKETGFEFNQVANIIKDFKTQIEHEYKQLTRN